tara:strand:- start:3005 stop:3490 length:486 start_codon:yes stop_codon:yes gene_type:complete
MMGLFGKDSVGRFLLRYVVVFVAFWGILMSSAFAGDGDKLLTWSGPLDWRFYFLVIVAFVPPLYMGLAQIASMTIIGAFSGWEKLSDAVFVGLGFSVFVGPFVTMMLVESLTLTFSQKITSSLLIATIAIWLNYLLTAVKMLKPKIPGMEEDGPKIPVELP